MDDIHIRLEQELKTTLARLKQVARPEEIEDLPPSLGSIFDDGDQIQADQAREMGLMTKGRLLQRANKLASALRRLEAGEYGLCLQCGDAIKPARLAALPEVETCLTCQDEIERRSRGLQYGSIWDQQAA
jgi:DnaK suppressor protein